jgi:hypothetical protein
MKLFRKNFKREAFNAKDSGAEKFHSFIGSKTRKFLAKAPDKNHPQQSTKEKEAPSKEQAKGLTKAPYKTLLRSLMSLLVSNMIRNIQNNC